MLKKEHNSSSTAKPLYNRDISRTPIGSLPCSLCLSSIRKTWGDDDEDDSSMVTDISCEGMYNWDRGFWSDDDENIPSIQVTDVSFQGEDWDRGLWSDDEDYRVIRDCINDEVTEKNNTTPSSTLSQTLDLTSSIRSKALDPLIALKEEYYALGKETDFIISERRVCNFNYANDSLYNIGRAQRAVFITNDEILSSEPMKFLPHSPFIKPTGKEEQTYIDGITDVAELRKAIDTRAKAAQAIAITRSGKHVILQQAVRSCVPTCVAMLGLDHEKIPNYDLIVNISLANDEEQSLWLKELGFEVYPLKLQLLGENLTAWPKIIFKHLAELGPGILSVTHPEIGNHVIILDAISPDLQTATIRDPFHGRMVTIKIALLQSWINSSPAAVHYLELMQVKCPN